MCVCVVSYLDSEGSGGGGEAESATLKVAISLYTACMLLDDFSKNTWPKLGPCSSHCLEMSIVFTIVKLGRRRRESGSN